MKLEIVGKFPPIYYPFCFKCYPVTSSFHKFAYQENPSPELRETQAKISDFLGILHQRFGQSLRVYVTDWLSPIGLWKTIRHGIKAYPAFIVNGKKTFQGLESLDEVAKEIERQLFKEGKTE